MAGGEAADGAAGLAALPLGRALHGDGEGEEGPVAGVEDEDLAGAVVGDEDAPGGRVQGDVDGLAELGEREALALRARPVPLRHRLGAPVEREQQALVGVAEQGQADRGPVPEARPRQRPHHLPARREDEDAGVAGVEDVVQPVAAHGHLHRLLQPPQLRGTGSVERPHRRVVPGYHQLQHPPLLQSPTLKGRKGR